MIGEPPHRPFGRHGYLVWALAWGLVAGARAQDASMMRATQDAFRAVAGRLSGSLVRIETVGGAQPANRILDDPEQENAEAVKRRRAKNLFRDAPGSSFVVADGPTTGIVYSADGYIIASSFNFVSKPLVIFVTLPDGRRLDAQLVARDQVRKIALLKIDAEGLNVPPWRSDADVRVGEWAIALGMGFGGDHPSVTVGIISALDRMNGNAIQTDAKLSPANYGGPLCDIEGNVFGVCVPMAQRPGELAGVEFYDSGIGFALPKRRVDEIVAVLKTGRSFYRGWLGISVDARAKGGALIRKVADPSPARQAGLRPGDRIRWAEGHDVHHFAGLVQAIYMIPAGEEIHLQFERRSRTLAHYYAFGDVSYARWIGTHLDYGVRLVLARNTELGALPKQEQPNFTPPTEEKKP